MLVVGPNGAGKTNLLEAAHLGAQGFSPRTRSDAELLRFGAGSGRVRLQGDHGGRAVDVELSLQADEPKRASVNGARLRAAEQLRGELSALVFTPDRLSVVKGSPAVRRAYLDRAIGRVWPPRGSLPVEYAAAVGQRNAALRRVTAGFLLREGLAPWTARVAELGARLVAAREELAGALAGSFREAAGALGLDDAALRYEGSVPAVDRLDARLDRDLERGATGIGPHLDDVSLSAGGRELRTFGSQGEQRSAVLALLLAEAELLTERRGAAPLLLLDDVLSELDGERRRALVERIGGGGQALVTATSADALPVEPSCLVDVRPGSARRAR